MKLEFSGQIFDKSSNTKFRENSLSGSRTVSCGRPDIHEEANQSLFFFFFFNFANEPESNKKLNRTVQWPLAAPSTKDTVYSSQTPWEVPNYGTQLTDITILVYISLASVASCTQCVWLPCCGIRLQLLCLISILVGSVLTT